MRPMRVQIPPYSDHWMRGDRYGEVVRTDTLKFDGEEIVRITVLLDKSGRRARFDLDDCLVVEMQ